MDIVLALEFLRKELEKEVRNGEKTLVNGNFAKLEDYKQLVGRVQGLNIAQMHLDGLIERVTKG